MKVLVACEESQRVCIEFRKKGHEAYSCDIIDCSGGHPDWHIKGDVLPLLNGNCEFETSDGKRHKVCGTWDMIIAFPPCTHLAVSGARHFEKKRKDGRQFEALEFFSQFLKCKCERVVIENPVGIIGGSYVKEHFPQFAWMPKPSQKIQPYEHGHPSRKSTCLWIKGVSPLKPTKVVKPELVTYECKSGKKVTFSRDYCVGLKNRSSDRSKTYWGVAKAMAEQWG